MDKGRLTWRKPERSGLKRTVTSGFSNPFLPLDEKYSETDQAWVVQPDFAWVQILTPCLWATPSVNFPGNGDDNSSCLREETSHSSPVLHNCEPLSSFAGGPSRNTNLLGCSLSQAKVGCLWLGELSFIFGDQCSPGIHHISCGSRSLISMQTVASLCASLCHDFHKWKHDDPFNNVLLPITEGSTQLLNRKLARCTC